MASPFMLSPIRGYLPHIIVGVSISLIMVGAYAAVSLASVTAPKSLWTRSPLTITFQASSQKGSAPDSFKCAPPVTGPIILKILLSTTKLSLTTNIFPSFASCGPSFTDVTFVATCLVTPASCRGTYSGSVQISEPSRYRTFSPDLGVTIVVA